MKLEYFLIIFSYICISIELNAQKIIVSEKQNYTFYINETKSEKFENEKRKIILTDSTIKIEMYDNNYFSGNFEKTIDEKTNEVTYIIKNGGLFQILKGQVFFNLMATEYKCFIDYWTDDDAYAINELNKLKREEESEQEWYEFYVEHFGKFTADCIRENEIKIGMKKLGVITIFGQPINKNITETKYSYSEQWVYENMNVYIENGIVSAIQTSE